MLDASNVGGQRRNEHASDLSTDVFPLLAIRLDSENSLPTLNESQLSDIGRAAIREAQEIRRVNAKLLQGQLPEHPALAYAAVCIEASQAGGDFYDFFELGPHRFGFVIGDISGKGLAAALLRACVQATLRTLCAIGIQDLRRCLEVVNRILCDNAPEAAYATLFLAEYNELTGRLRYVNCGHLAPLLHGPEGVWRLQATTTILGIFSDLQCPEVEIDFPVGSTLLLYTDGATEATNSQGDEFGEERLIEPLRNHPQLPLSEFLQSSVDRISQFSEDRQEDDMTLVGLRRWI